jgi:hypothetical protein
MYKSTLFLDLGTRRGIRGQRHAPAAFESREGRGEGSASRPGRFITPVRNRYPLYRRLGGPQGWSGQVRKISPPPGFDPRSFKPVISRYAD